MSRVAFLVLSGVLVACAQGVLAPGALAEPHDALIARHAAANGVPEALVRRLIRIESRGNAGVVSKGNYGLMQIRLGTARGVGYSGDARGLLDADTNLAYAVKYLAGAYRAAGCNADRAVGYYQRGYYGARQTRCVADAPALVPVDVLKPRVVRIETFGAGPGRSAEPSRPFEPVRIAVQPAPDAAMMQLASLPLPRERPEFSPATRRGKHARASRGARAMPMQTAGVDTARSGEPGDPVVSVAGKIAQPARPARSARSSSRRASSAVVSLPSPQTPQ